MAAKNWKPMMKPEKAGKMMGAMDMYMNDSEACMKSGHDVYSAVVCMAEKGWHPAMPMKNSDSMKNTMESYGGDYNLCMNAGAATIVAGINCMASKGWRPM